VIDNKNIEWYFNFMKSNGFIAEYWNYDGYLVDGDHIKILYIHKSGKRSSYRFLKEIVTQEIREAKLRRLFN
jgi:hypothetical protein